MSEANQKAHEQGKPPPPERATSLLPTGEYAVTWTWEGDIIYAILYRSQIDADLGHKSLKVTGDPNRLATAARMYA
jgi:hypothetical protein